MAGSLSGTVAVVTGASRGIGKGIAIELGRQGATVYVTGRKPEQRLNFPNTSTLDEVAEEITKVGGKGIAAYCNHEQPADIKSVFERVEREQQKLDILVNNAYAAVQFIGRHVDKKFYDTAIPESPEEVWDIVNNVGLKNHYICSVYAARLMTKQSSGLIVTVSSPAGAKHLFNVSYSIGKTACDKLAADIAHDLVGSKVASISLWPGAVKTEIIEQTVLAGRGKTDKTMFERGESIYYSGKCIAALAADSKRLATTGRIITTHELGEKYNLRDVDDNKPEFPFFEQYKPYLDLVNAVRTHAFQAKI